MCCVGCEAVSRSIIEAGLGDYYLQRSEYSQRVSADLLERSQQTERASRQINAGNALAGKVEDATSTPAAQHATFYLYGLRCAACAWLAERTIANVAGVAAVEVNLTSHSAAVAYDGNVCDDERITSALARVGLSGDAIRDRDRHQLRQARQRERKRDWLAFGVAALCMMQVMMLVVPLYIATPGEIEADSARLMTWAAWLLTLPVLMFSARDIIRGTLVEIMRGHWRSLSMDTPIGIALISTFSLSTWSLITGTGHHYFDAISMFVTLILGVRLVESGLRQRTLEAIERFSNTRPVTATRLAAFPDETLTETLTAAALSVNDIVRVGPGEVIPADAIIVRGESEIDESLLTGESLPVRRRVGDPLIAGSVNTHGVLIARVTAHCDASVIAQLARKVESNLVGRTTGKSALDWIARLLAPATMLLALISGLVWLWLLPEYPQRALDVAVAVLVVTCPCAFALAVPAAQAAVLAHCISSGLLITRSHVVESLANVTDIVFDKTGTLTMGHMSVVGVVLTAPERELGNVLAVVRAMEQGNNHPVARALLAYADTYAADNLGITKAPRSLTIVAGHGVEATIDGAHYRLGAKDWAIAQDECGRRTDDVTYAANRADTEIVLSVAPDGAESSRTTLAQFLLRDTVRAESTSTVATLQSMGIRVHLLSGDAESVVAHCAREIGLDPALVRSRQSSSDKQGYIHALRAASQNQQGTVVAVGDGTNDAQMLTSAHVGIGLASGTALTKLAADAVQSTDRSDVLSNISAGIQCARRGHQVLRQNIIWAFAYNLIAVPLAIAGLATPLLAAIGMAASSLIVVVNAARLVHQPKGRC
jgi:Cu2+-exporting ATPase